jgi:hypothetical protein
MRKTMSITIENSRNKSIYREKLITPRPEEDAAPSQPAACSCEIRKKDNDGVKK